MALNSASRRRRTANNRGKQRVLRKQLDKISKQIKTAKSPAERSWLLTKKYSILRQLDAFEMSSSAVMETPEDLLLDGMPSGIEIRNTELDS